MVLLGGLLDQSTELIIIESEKHFLLVFWIFYLVGLLDLLGQDIGREVNERVGNEEVLVLPHGLFQLVEEMKASVQTYVNYSDCFLLVCPVLPSIK